uniref:NR LBD domain-containing protein n=1 Tax=Acrobeloides nanus TaxID=290746 RepID=A0A914CIJ2_9BILA
MKAENVRIQMVSLNSAFINELDGILNKLTYFHRSVYYNRMQSIKIKTKSTPKALQNMHKTIYNVFKTESEILQSYFESLGLFDLVYYMDDVEYFFNEALHVWMRFEIGLSTLRNGGLSNNILYYIDNASKSINEDFLYNYYATSSRGKNFDVCARAECDYYHHFLQILTKMYQYRFDEIETSVIRQLLIIITLQESCKRKSEAIRIIDEHKKDLFVSLYKYYKNNDIDYASRLGDLICITSEYQKLITLYNELKSIMDINGIWPMKWKWKWVSEKKLEVAMQFN